jgi:signal transduction histidine kinase
MNVLAGLKGLMLKTSLDPNLPTALYGDEQRLQQLLVNLVGNAIKFTPSGEVSVSFLTTDNAHWAIQVADSGIGIPKEAQEYIFEPFRQVDTSNTHRNRGTGLGLSITKQLVELMDGQILLESGVGEGSTFTVLLPLLITDRSPHDRD